MEAFTFAGDSFQVNPQDYVIVNRKPELRTSLDFVLNKENP